LQVSRKDVVGIVERRINSSYAHMFVSMMSMLLDLKEIKSISKEKKNEGMRKDVLRAVSI